LLEAHTAVEAAQVATATELDPAPLAGLRARYDKAVTWGQTTNRHRDWDGKGKHPGYTLAKRLADKADQVWLFTTVFSVPWTNNASEQALTSPKLHQKVSTTPSPATPGCHPSPPDHTGGPPHRSQRAGTTALGSCLGF
jgi:hypothetical protein